MGVDDERRRDNQKSVAIGCSASHRLGADCGTGPGPVLNRYCHRLRPADVLCHYARENIAGTASGSRDNQLDRFGRLRPRLIAK